MADLFAGNGPAGGSTALGRFLCRHAGDHPGDFSGRRDVAAHGHSVCRASACGRKTVAQRLSPWGLEKTPAAGSAPAVSLFPAGKPCPAADNFFPGRCGVGVRSVVGDRGGLAVSEGGGYFTHCHRTCHGHDGHDWSDMDAEPRGSRRKPAAGKPPGGSGHGLCGGQYAVGEGDEPALQSLDLNRPAGGCRSCVLSARCTRRMASSGGCME